MVRKSLLCLWIAVFLLPAFAQDVIRREILVGPRQGAGRRQHGRS